MSPEEVAELRAAVAAVAQQDVQLGRVLNLLVEHLLRLVAPYALAPAMETSVS